MRSGQKGYGHLDDDGGDVVAVTEKREKQYADHGWVYAACVMSPSIWRWHFFCGALECLDPMTGRTMQVTWSLRTLAVFNTASSSKRRRPRIYSTTRSTRKKRKTWKTKHQHKSAGFEYGTGFAEDLHRHLHIPRHMGACRNAPARGAAQDVHTLNPELKPSELGMQTCRVVLPLQCKDGVFSRFGWCQGDRRARLGNEKVHQPGIIVEAVGFDGL